MTIKILTACIIISALLSGQAFCQTGIDSLEIVQWQKNLKANMIPLKKGSLYADAPNGFALYTSHATDIEAPYCIYVPKSYQPEKKSPLMIFLHGGVSGKAEFGKSNFSTTKEPIFALSEKYGYIVLYPFAKSDFGWLKQPAAFEQVITDISEVEERYNIDHKNIFLGGMSDGGSAVFWYLTNKTKLFKAFFAISGYPKLFGQPINFRNITTKHRLYTVNAVDDSVAKFRKVKSIYEQHRIDAKGWQFDSVRVGGHGLIYSDNGVNYLDTLLTKLAGENTLMSINKNRFNKLVASLDSVAMTDQAYRIRMNEVRKAYGGSSDQMKTLMRKMHEADSLNLLTVSKILDTYGWLNPRLVGEEHSHTLFMVIQHADSKAQKHYLPILREAANKRILKPSSLALLEDRVALREGGKQIYGSQVSWNLKTNKYTMLPLIDPENVDKRRAKVGLEPLAKYVKDCCDMTWDLQQFKKDEMLNAEKNN